MGFVPRPVDNEGNYLPVKGVGQHPATAGNFIPKPVHIEAVPTGTGTKPRPVPADVEIIADVDSPGDQVEGWGVIMGKRYQGRTVYLNVVTDDGEMTIQVSGGYQPYYYYLLFKRDDFIAFSGKRLLSGNVAVKSEDIGFHGDFITEEELEERREQAGFDFDMTYDQVFSPF